VTELPFGIQLYLADLGGPPSKLPCVGRKIERIRILKSQSDSTHGGHTHPPTEPQSHGNPQIQSGSPSQQEDSCRRTQQAEPSPQEPGATRFVHTMAEAALASAGAAADKQAAYLALLDGYIAANDTKSLEVRSLHRASSFSSPCAAQSRLSSPLQAAPTAFAHRCRSDLKPGCYACFALSRWRSHMCWPHRRCATNRCHPPTPPPPPTPANKAGPQTELLIGVSQVSPTLKPVLMSHLTAALPKMAESAGEEAHVALATFFLGKINASNTRAAHDRQVRELQEIMMSNDAPCPPLTSHGAPITSRFD
jgi:hypothetical protein